MALNEAQSKTNQSTKHLPFIQAFVPAALLWICGTNGHGIITKESLRFLCSHAFTLYLNPAHRGCHSVSFSSYLNTWTWKKWTGWQWWRFWMGSKYAVPLLKLTGYHCSKCLSHRQQWRTLSPGVPPWCLGESENLWSLVDWTFNSERGGSLISLEQTIVSAMDLFSFLLHFCQHHLLNTYSMPYSVMESYCFWTVTYFTANDWRQWNDHNGIHSF